jgi:hypothetical protein
MDLKFGNLDHWRVVTVHDYSTRLHIYRNVTLSNPPFICILQYGSVVFIPAAAPVQYMAHLLWTPLRVSDQNTPQSHSETRAPSE